MIAPNIIDKLLKFLHIGGALMVPILARLRTIYMWSQYVRQLIKRGDKKMLTSEDYDKAYSLISLNEGFSNTNSKDDHGGLTKGGVTQKFLDAHGIKMDVRTMTKTQRKEIFFDYIWNPCKYSSLKDLRIATKVFDMNVNMGAYEAHLLLQRAINQVNPGSVKVDGYIGPKTIEAANACNQEALLAALRQESVDFYNGLVDKDASQAKFLKDWLDRAWE